MDIAKMLTLSTAHITKETASELANRSAYWTNYDLCIYDKDDFGWWIHICNEGVEDLSRVPTDLVACIRLARIHDCDWLCLDRDGLVEESLKTYEWEE